MLITSLANKKGNTSFPRSIMATLRCTAKGAKQQSKLESPEDWERLIKSLGHWVVDLQRKGMVIAMIWPWTKKSLEDEDRPIDISDDQEERKEKQRCVSKFN